MNFFKLWFFKFLIYVLNKLNIIFLNIIFGKNFKQLKNDTFEIWFWYAAFSEKLFVK